MATAGRMVSEIDEPFVAPYVRSSEHSGNSKAFSQNLSNEASAIVRRGLGAFG